MKRLPKALIEVNDRAREENEKKNPSDDENASKKTSKIKGEEVVDEINEEEQKPKHKRRTKAEIEEARRKEAEAKEIIIKDVHTDKDGVVQVNAQVINTINKIETEIELPKPEDSDNSPKDVYSEEETNEDELPFTFDSEEERQRIIGNPLGDIVNGKPVYFHTDEPVIKVKRPRGRPRKNPINE